MRYEFSSFCPTEEQLGEYINHTLDPRDREQLARHLDNCKAKPKDCFQRMLDMLQARRDAEQQQGPNP